MKLSFSQNIQPFKKWFLSLKKPVQLALILIIIFATSGVVMGATAKEYTEEIIEDIPFETVIKYDDNRFQNEESITQEGIIGKKIVKVRHYNSLGLNYAYKNIDERIITGSKNKIITRGRLTKVQETEEAEIPFSIERKPDSGLLKGQETVSQAGFNGTKKITYEVIRLETKIISRTIINEVVILQPRTQVISYGTKTQNCDPNYSGACVPIASDVDCAGGSGNGPAYVWGPVYVIGYDKYDLDRDGDGVGCE